MISIEETLEKTNHLEFLPLSRARQAEGHFSVYIQKINHLFLLDGQKHIVFRPKWSQRVSSQSVNFMRPFPKGGASGSTVERHVMMAKNGHFFVRNGLTFFLT